MANNNPGDSWNETRKLTGEMEFDLLAALPSLILPTLSIPAYLFHVSANGDPISAAHHLSSEQATAMRAGARCSEEFKGSAMQASATGFCEPATQPPPERVKAPTPMNSNDEDASTSEDQKSKMASAKRRAQTRGLPPEWVRGPAKVNPTMTTRSQARALPDESGRAGSLEEPTVEAHEWWPVQGKRVCVRQIVSLPIPES
jgi:hypothetical protein